MLNVSADKAICTILVCARSACSSEAFGWFSCEKLLCLHVRDFVSEKYGVDLYGLFSTLLLYLSLLWAPDISIHAPLTEEEPLRTRVEHLSSSLLEWRGEWMRLVRSSLGIHALLASIFSPLLCSVFSMPGNQKADIDSNDDE